MRLQYTNKYNVVRLWNDSFISKASENNGKLIVTSIIDSGSIPYLDKPSNKTVRKPSSIIKQRVESRSEPIALNNHEKAGVKTDLKNERYEMIDSFVLTFIKNNDGVYLKKDLVNSILENEKGNKFISKNSVTNSIVRLEEKHLIIFLSNKIHITTEGIEKINKQTK